MPSRIWPLSPRKINGIGPKATAKLTRLGIATIGVLAQADRGIWWSNSASYGAWLHEAAHGRDERPVVTTASRSRSAAKPRSSATCIRVRDREALSRIFTDLCLGLTDDLQRKGYAGKTIGLKLRYDDFRTVTRDRTLDAPTQDMRDDTARRRRVPEERPLDRRIRLLGVRIGALTPIDDVGATPAQEEDPTASWSERGRKRKTPPR